MRLVLQTYIWRFKFSVALIGSVLKKCTDTLILPSNFAELALWVLQCIRIHYAFTVVSYFTVCYLTALEEHRRKKGSHILPTSIRLVLEGKRALKLPKCCFQNKHDFMLDESVLKNKVLGTGRDFL